MNILEKDIEDLIFEASQSQKGREILLNRGLNICTPLKRQVNLGSYGIADLIDVIPDNTAISYNVIELKKVSLSIEDILQLSRYITGMNRFLRENTPDFANYHNVRGTLIGPDLKGTKDIGYLINQLYGIHVLTYNYDLEKGLKFTHLHGFHKSNEILASDSDIHLGMQSILSDHYHRLSEEELKKTRNA